MISHSSKTSALVHCSRSTECNDFTSFTGLTSHMKWCKLPGRSSCCRSITSRWAASFCACKESTKVLQRSCIACGAVDLLVIFQTWYLYCIYKLQLSWMYCWWLWRDGEGIEFLPKETRENILQKDAVVLLPRIGLPLTGNKLFPQEKFAPKAYTAYKAQLPSLKKAYLVGNVGIFGGLSPTSNLPVISTFFCRKLRWWSSVQR